MTSAVELGLDFSAGDAQLAIRGGEVSRRVSPVATVEMLTSFREVVAGRAEPALTSAQRARVVELARGALTALEAGGVVFVRAGEPKHVASRALREP